MLGLPKFFSIMCLLFSLPVNAGLQHLSIVYTGYLPHLQASSGSYAQLGTLLKQQRQHHSTLFLFGGASLAPSLMSSLDRGAHIIDILNNLQPDAMAISGRELIYSIDELSLRAHEAAFPMILSNATDTLTGNHIDDIDAQLIINKQGMNIGLLSVMDYHSIMGYKLSRLHIDDSMAHIAMQAKKLRQQGADFVILMASHGVQYTQALLEQSIINLALRSNPYLDAPSTAQVYAKNNHEIYLKKHGSAAVITLSWPTGTHTITDFTTQFIPLSSLPEEPRIKQYTNIYTQRFSTLFDHKITVLTTPIDLHYSVLRTTENAFGNLVADAMRIESNADIAIINSGAIRSNAYFPAGHTLTNGDVMAALPFRDKIKVLKVTGQQIKDSLEVGVSVISPSSGSFPQVSGMHFHVDQSKPPGARIEDLTINNHPIEKNKEYTLATTTFLYHGGDGYRPLLSALEIGFSQQVTPLISDIVISHLNGKPTLSVKRDLRIVLSNGEHHD
ncbi:bifunctional metallophosphatase/5'-nucleotidase [Vibrio zhugei]|uniref:Bifunctional metallophosphatase/5'-nucleotidase n=1 Tax=Vibrio zhugei TaxID=2479546 RepID=A0ABV7C9B2_9VIBR|nr:bifunctional metallophosphatase/5'-nucleotidase [Vibrio zhugei]